MIFQGIKIRGIPLTMLKRFTGQEFVFKRVLCARVYSVEFPNRESGEVGHKDSMK